MPKRRRAAVAEALAERSEALADALAAAAPTVRAVEVAAGRLVALIERKQGE